MGSTVCLVRHGETDWNLRGRLQGQEDIELNETGIYQATRCGLYLARESWDVILTSPLSRARKIPFAARVDWIIQYCDRHCLHRLPRTMFFRREETSCPVTRSHRFPGP